MMPVAVNESVTLVPEDVSIIQVSVHPQVLSHVPIFQPGPDIQSESRPVNVVGYRGERAHCGSAALLQYIPS